MRSLWLLTALLAGLAGPLAAETLRIPVGEQGGQHLLTLPQRGQSQASVSQRWGQPLKIHAAVGQPPISRWDYLEFSVYFEHNHVISSVRQHHPRRTAP